MIRAMIKSGVCAFLLLLVTPLFGAESAEKKIGLALSGGGARGLAHIGVLRMLEQQGVKIDYIAGTSMGAIVGGLYASGMSPADIEQVVKQIDWDTVLSDAPDRRDRPMRSKQFDADQLVKYRLGFNKGGVQLPLGAVQGQHLDKAFRKILEPVLHIRDFDQLAIPFRAVTTNLATGGEVVLGSGNLVTALRASMSIPGVFSPVEIRDKLLVDGGMANNLPVSVVREMGADVVIAVDISTPLYPREKLDSILVVTEQITGFLTRRNTEEQIASLSAEDLLIIPELGEVGSADFKQYSKAIEAGHQAALEVETRLAALAENNATGYRPLVFNTLQLDGRRIAFIDVDNQSALNDDLLKSRLRLRSGDVLDTAVLQKDLDRIYALDVFELVTYHLQATNDDQVGVHITALPRRWGPNYLQFGLELADDFSGVSDYTLSAAYTRNAINTLGGELRVEGKVGRINLLGASYYQPLDREANYFVETELAYFSEPVNVFSDSQVQIGRVELGIFGFGFGVGRNFDTHGQLRLDYHRQRGDIDRLDGEFVLPDDKFDNGQLQLSYLRDTLDNINFPSTGELLDFHIIRAMQGLGADQEFTQYSLSALFARNYGPNRFFANLNSGYTRDAAAPIQNLFTLGGFGRLSGLVPDQLSGQHLGLLSLGWYRELNQNKFLPLYAGITAEVGNVWQNSDDISFTNSLWAGSVYFGADTILGPIYLGYGYAEGGDNTFYLSLGNPFGLGR